MSDEIPVGSPPVPPGRHAAPGGWYADPAKPGQERYWDGWNWTRNTRPAEAQPPAQPQWGSYAGPGQPGGQPQGQWGGQAPQGQMPPQGQWQTYGQPAHNPYGPPVPVTADGVPLAGWWWRVLAMLIDGLVVGAANEVVGAVTGLSARVSASTTAAMEYLFDAASTGDLDTQRLMSMIMTRDYYILLVIGVVIFVAYHGIMLATRGATLGKMATGLRVVPFGQGRHQGGLSWGTAILRPAIYQLFSQINVLVLVDVLFPLWDRNKQTLHDKIVKTQVVKIR